MKQGVIRHRRLRDRMLTARCWPYVAWFKAERSRMARLTSCLRSDTTGFSGLRLTFLSPQRIGRQFAETVLVGARKFTEVPKAPVERFGGNGS